MVDPGGDHEASRRAQGTGSDRGYDHSYYAHFAHFLAPQYAKATGAPRGLHKAAVPLENLELQ